MMFDRLSTSASEYLIQKLKVKATLEARTSVSKPRCQLSGVGKEQKGSNMRATKSQSVMLG